MSRRCAISLLLCLLVWPVHVDSEAMLDGSPRTSCWYDKTMLHLKPGVNPHNIQPEVTLLIQIVSSVYAKHGYDCLVTRLYDYTPQQLANSLHNRDGLCRAADFKTIHLPETIKQVMLGEIRAAVGYDDTQPRAFDFILEPRITAPDGRIVKEEHFHGEFDSKFPPAQIPVKET